MTPSAPSSPSLPLRFLRGLVLFLAVLIVLTGTALFGFAVLSALVGLGSHALRLLLAAAALVTGGVLLFRAGR